MLPELLGDTQHAHAAHAHVGGGDGDGAAELLVQAYRIGSRRRCW
ncbi:hypothetical protein OG559_01915 [Micromonospora sp. NBC_01405]